MTHSPAILKKACRILDLLSELEPDTVTGLGEAASRAKQILVAAIDRPRARVIEPIWIGKPPGDDDDRRAPAPGPTPVLSPELEPA